MTLEEKKRKYARMLAKVGLNVQKGQTVLVEAAVEGYDFVPVFAEECYKLGASNVVVSYLDLASLKVRSRYAGPEEMTSVDDVERSFYQYYLDGGACYVRLEGVNPSVMADLPEDKASAVFDRIDAVRNVMRAASRQYRCQWLIAMIPTKEWAEYILPDSEDSLSELWDLLLRLCYIDEQRDVSETWEESLTLRRARARKIDEMKIRKLHYTASNGTDLTVELTPFSLFGEEDSAPDGRIRFSPNIPSEEICTTPEKYGTNGVVYATRPLVLGGKTVENFGFRFKDGKVCEVIAGAGKEMLENLVATDENSGYLGECALVEYHSPISMSGIVYYTTLIDENASCHLALGRGLDAALPQDSPYTFNDSSIHVDFMIGTPDMSIVGTDADGCEHVIFKDGDFAI